ncbi:MAG: hypothetical protein KKC84_00465 [Candidatus Omnitrophica bacterium]|nr:hypothetical protein [Candidatus Omnitrophota bacterium]
MENNLEKLIARVYSGWRAVHSREHKSHPDEESWVCFLAGKSSPEEVAAIKEHVTTCHLCAEKLVIDIHTQPQVWQEVPRELIKKAQGLVAACDQASILQIILRMREHILEMISTTGDVLVGHELIPAPVLRSRKIKDFKDEVTILKDIDQLRVEVKIENESSKSFSAMVRITQKQTQETLKDLRITLIKDDRELESYVTGSGMVTFEHVKVGVYKIEVTDLTDTLAMVVIDMRV